MLNVELVFGLVFVGCLWLFSLWENPPQWRTLRQTEGGIFHRQAAALWVRVVLAAAWWHENVASASCVPVCDFLNLLLKKIRPQYSSEIPNFIGLHVVPFLLLDFIVWRIAKDYLQDKWQTELEESNRKWLKERGL